MTFAAGVFVGGVIGFVAAAMCAAAAKGDRTRPATRDHWASAPHKLERPVSIEEVRARRLHPTGYGVPYLAPVVDLETWRSN